MDLAALYVGGQSIPEIAAKIGWPRSRVRHALLAAGVTLRTRAEAIQLARPKLGSGLRGKKRPPFTAEHRARISAGRLAHGDAHAKGTRLTTTGYIEYTRGPHKGRAVHVVVMETRLGRHLLPDEHIHHIDGMKTNNDDSNLALMTRAGHARHHRFLDAAKGKVRERATNGRLA